jgi:hypothetical protein
MTRDTLIILITFESGLWAKKMKAPRRYVGGEAEDIMKVKGIGKMTFSVLIILGRNRVICQFFNWPGNPLTRNLNKE